MVALPLSLAAPLLKGPLQDPKSWRTLHDALARGLGTDRTRTVETRMHAVLDMSFGAMADDPGKQERCVFLSVLAPGACAYSEMLEDLWDEVGQEGVGSSDPVFVFRHVRPPAGLSILLLACSIRQRIVDKLHLMQFGAYLRLPLKARGAR